MYLQRCTCTYNPSTRANHNHMFTSTYAPNRIFFLSHLVNRWLQRCSRCLARCLGASWRAMSSVPPPVACRSAAVAVNHCARSVVR